MNSTAVIIEVYAAGAVTGAGLMWLWATSKAQSAKPIPPAWMPRPVKAAPVTEPITEPALDADTTPSPVALGPSLEALRRPSPFAPKPRSTTWTPPKPSPAKPDPVQPPRMPSVDWGNCK